MRLKGKQAARIVHGGEIGLPFLDLVWAVSMDREFALQLDFVQEPILKSTSCPGDLHSHQQAQILRAASMIYAARPMTNLFDSPRKAAPNDWTLDLSAKHPETTRH